jgi:hypothetical protein
MMILTLWSHFGPGPVHGLRDCQTDSSSYLCNSVICMICSTWMLWIRYFSAASSCKFLEKLIFFPLITSSIEMCFLPHIIFTMYFASLHLFLLTNRNMTVEVEKTVLLLPSLILNAFARHHWTARITLLLSLCPICAMPSNYMLKRIWCLPLILVRTSGLQWQTFRSSGRSTILFHWRQLILILTLSSESLMSKLFLS